MITYLEERKTHLMEEGEYVHGELKKHQIEEAKLIEKIAELKGAVVEVDKIIQEAKRKQQRRKRSSTKKVKKKNGK